MNDRFKRTGALALMGLVLILILGAPSCSDSDPPVDPTPNDEDCACCNDTLCQITKQDECAATGGTWLPGVVSCDPNPCQPSDPQVPDFTLTDVNRNSSREGQRVSLSDYEGQIVLVYFLYSGACPSCRAHLQGLTTLVDDLHGLGLTAVAAMAINSPAYAGEIHRIWEDMTTPLPVLQDTLTTVEGMAWPAVGWLLDCTSSDDFLVIDRDRTWGRKTRSCRPCEVDLSTSAGRARVADWVAELDSTGVITGS